MNSIPRFTRGPANRPSAPRPANDLDAAMARVVMPIGDDEEAKAWDEIVLARAA